MCASNSQRDYDVCAQVSAEVLATLLQAADANDAAFEVSLTFDTLQWKSAVSASPDQNQLLYWSTT